jgi:hypothetical protein
LHMESALMKVLEIIFEFYFILYHLSLYIETESHVVRRYERLTLL